MVGMVEVIIKRCLVGDQKHEFPKYPGNDPDRVEPKKQAEFKPRGKKGINMGIRESMDSSTKTIVLLVLGLACVAALVLLSFKEDEDSSGIRAGIRASVRGSHCHGEVRQVLKQITWEWQLMHSREDPKEQSQQF